MEKKFKVGCSPITSIIYAGNVNNDGTWAANKKDVTDTAVSAVAIHLLQLDQCMEFELRGKKYVIKVTEIKK